MRRVSVVLSVAAVMVFAGMVATADAVSPVVSNVTAQQRDGTAGAGTVVDITYDVEDADSDSADISIEMSNDGGTTFDVPCTTVTGDVGRVAVIGGDTQSKSVEWQAGADVPEVYWEQCQMKVIAEDVPSGAVGEIVVDLPGWATMTMVWIEPGTFIMGSPQAEGGAPGERPQHEVTITTGFYFGKYELTEGQWASVTGGTPVNPNMPKVAISWGEVQAFIDTLAAHGLTGFRLPTEAEWEYACRAGAETVWSFGDDE